MGNIISYMLLLFLFFGIIFAQSDENDEEAKSVFIPAKLGELNGEFDFYIRSWETENFIDPSIPFPTISQKDRRDEMQKQNSYEDVIHELTERDEDFMEAAEKGIEYLKFLSNYTDGIGDITEMNFSTTEHILRFNQRAKNNPKFQDELGYIGTLMQSIRRVNHKVQLVPVEDSQGLWQYVGKDFYDLPEIYGILSRIDRVSKHIETIFDEIHDIQYQRSCVDQVSQSQRILRKAFVHLMDYVQALNATTIKNDQRFLDKWQAFRESCTRKKCHNALQVLLQTINGHDRYKNCQPIKLTYKKHEKQNIFIYPCWRDFMVFRNGAIFQSVIQGLVVMSAYEQAKMPHRLEPSQYFTTSKFYSMYIEGVDKLQYWSSKCLFKNQGGFNARLQGSPFIHQVMQIPYVSIANFSDMGLLTYRWQQKILITQFFDLFHSDMMWQIKMYDTPQSKYDTRDYNSPVAAYNIKGTTILIFGIDAHQYHWGRYKDDPYQEFCYVKDFRMARVWKRLQYLDSFFDLDKLLEDRKDDWRT